MSEKSKWIVVSIFAIAMAWVETSVVVYLRTMIERIEPYQPNPLPNFAGFGEIELVREFATLVMLLTVGWLAGRTWHSRLAYSAIAFGIWDIFYYVFLVPTSGWPRSLFDWDILFLLPLPWWGPVIAPVSISLLLITGGTLVTQFDAPNAPMFPRWLTLGISFAGSLIALYVFMADALRVAGSGVETIRNTLPTQFNWGVFMIALAMMATPIVDMSWRILRNRRWFTASKMDNSSAE